MMPSGRYYVGDLCYVMGDDEWAEVCKIVFSGSTFEQGEFSLKDGRRFAIYSTTWGDGVYADQASNEYSVDSGSIGCIRVEDIRVEKYENIEDLGAIHEFQGEFVTSRDDGVLQFGRVLIDTDPEYDADEDWY